MQDSPQDDDSEVPFEGLPPVEVPIDGSLDLHTFHPKELSELIPAYLDACLERGILSVRIIHGKGKGVLRRRVRSILKNHPRVKDFYHEAGSGGAWGATVVDLEP